MKYSRKKGRSFAKGTHARAISDRDGMEYPYLEMRKEWNGLMVHKDEWEPKHPQLAPRSASDATALKNARPDNDVESDANEDGLTKTGDTWDSGATLGGN